MGRYCGGGAGARRMARQQLDEMLGKDRNRPLTDKQRRVSHFSDEEFCKYFLVGFCPYTLFTNTKSDMGECTKSHSEAMRTMWERVPAMDRASYRYEDDMQAFLEDCVRTVDKIITARKGESAQKERQITPDEELLRLRRDMEERIQRLEDEQDHLNDDGRFDEARKVMETILLLQEDIKAKNKEIDDLMQREKMKILGVCDVCGVKIEMADDSADARHLVGKQHVGYEQIRGRLESLRAEQENRRELRKQFREQHAAEKDKDKEKEGDSRDRREKGEDREARGRDYNRYRY